MHYYDYAEAIREAQEAANELYVPVRVIAFDKKPFFEGEYEGVMYVHINSECTYDQIVAAGYRNPRICRTLTPMNREWLVNTGGR